MITSDMNKLLELISDLVNGSEGTWTDRRDALLNCADSSDKTNLAEFAAWFSEDDA